MKTTTEPIRMTKENLFNQMQELFPVAMREFCKWIDEYKKRVNWNQLFNSDSDYQNAEGKNAPAPKFHDLPIEMQAGIFGQFLTEQHAKCHDVMIPNSESLLNEVKSHVTETLELLNSIIPDPHQNCWLAKEIAKEKAKEHQCNYNVVIFNPSENGSFLPGQSTFEFVADSYFEKERPNVRLLYKTDDLLAGS